jgi:hypothetical protein
MTTAQVAPRPRLRPGGGQPATTPGRLRALLVTMILLSLTWGVLAALTADQHASAAGNVVTTSEPLSLDAEEIYQSLSDADATAANAFLSGGLEPAAASQRYDADVTQAAIRIEAASALVGSSAARTQLPGRLSTQAAAALTATGDDLATLSADLPVYTGDIQTARADNRLGLPLGGAYLREASGLLRGKLLAAASDIYTRQAGLLTAASAQATGLPLLTVAFVIGLVLAYLLIRTSRWLARHTHRVVNPGLLLGLVVVAAGLIWLGTAFAVGRNDLLHAQQAGSAPAQAFARADVAALQAHADESLTLIDNTGDDAYQQDFLLQQKLLGPGPGSLLAVTGTAGGSAAGADAQTWYRAHAALRAKDGGGDHDGAVKSALSGASATAFGALSADLTSGIATGQATFAASARAGRDAFTGLASGMLTAGLLAAAGCAWGLTRRLAEYR